MKKYKIFTETQKLFKARAIIYTEHSCAETALGMKDGRIKDNQLSMSSCAEGKCNKYGPHRGRLDMTSYPPGAQIDRWEKDPNPWFQVGTP